MSADEGPVSAQPDPLQRLDDPDYPALTMSQAADLLGVQAAFLRSLDTSGVLQPHRSPGGHRRYSRHQLRRAARLLRPLDDRPSLAWAATAGWPPGAGGGRATATPAPRPRGSWASRAGWRRPARTPTDCGPRPTDAARPSMGCARRPAPTQGRALKP